MKQDVEEFIHLNEKKQINKFKSKLLFMFTLELVYLFLFENVVRLSYNRCYFAFETYWRLNYLKTNRSCEKRLTEITAERSAANKSMFY